MGDPKSNICCYVLHEQFACLLKEDESSSWKLLGAETNLIYFSRFESFGSNLLLDYFFNARYSPRH